MQRYLYPQRKRLEILSAMFAGGYGVHIWAAGFHGEPLLWAGLHNGQALIFGQIMSMAAFVHALGVRINGHWRWSPALRLLGPVRVHVAADRAAALGNCGSEEGARPAEEVSDEPALA